MKMRYWMVFLLIFAISCQSASHSKPRQMVRINIQSEPQSLDPRKARDLNAVTLVHMLFEGLTRVGKAGTVEMALAESIEVSEDGLRYLFHLRESLWSNKEPVTAYDFVESWKKVLDPSFPTDLAYQLYVIKGAKEAKMGEASVDQVGLQAPDPRTLVVELKQPTPYFLELLTLPSFFPVFHRMDSQNVHWAEDVDSYVCNGPFVLKKWKHADKIQVVRNPAYWDANSVRLKRIEMVMLEPGTELRMFNDGMIDWAGSPLSTLPTDAICELKTKKELKVQPLMGTSFLRVNTTDSTLSDPDFRRALAFAIDRQKIAEHILQGGQLPAQALVPPTMGLAAHGYFPDAHFQEAQNLLATFLNKKGQGVAELEPIKMLFIAGERGQLIAQALQQQFQSVLGLKIELEAVERKMFFERISKKQYQLAASCSWMADFNDPINFLEVFKYKEGTNNTGWENPQYIERLNASVLCKDAEERKKILREAEQILMVEMPVIPIFHFALNYLEREGIEDVCLSPIGQIDFRWSHIEDQKAR